MPIEEQVMVRAVSKTNYFLPKIFFKLRQKHQPEYKTFGVDVALNLQNRSINR